MGMFMNEYEIEEARIRYRDHDVLGPATETLEAFKNAINACSDGWPYWHPATRAASALMRLIVGDGTNEYRRTVVTDLTAAEVRKAIRTMKSFATRHKISVVFTDPV